MFKQLIHYLAKKTKQYNHLAQRNFTVLNFHAVFQFCLQIDKANIIERYIHCVNYKHYRHLFNISGIHKFH